MSRTPLYLCLAVASCFLVFGAKPKTKLYLPHCKFDNDIIRDDAALNRTIAIADFVFSGKICSEVRIDRNKTIAFFVRIKRVFKSSGELSANAEVKVTKTLRDGEGFKCRQVVRHRYSAIFIGNKPLDVKEADVHLVISPVPVSLNNLDRISAATKGPAKWQGEVWTLLNPRGISMKDLNHKPRQQYVEEPCEKTFCAWGAHCVTGSDGRALCQCPTHCSDTVDPVCGTDNKTYKNHCQLRVTSCKARLNTRVKHAGECALNDPCIGKQCGFGAECIPSDNGLNASCVCPEKCSSYGDHSASRSVCGSDGVDYRDQCELQRAACKAKMNITEKFFGKCDPCSEVECAEPEVCQLDDHRNPVCRCGDTCPLEFTPVCGSDGKTYQNECSLRQEACRTRKTLNIIYRGKCSSGVNPCASVRCNSGEDCAINKYGIARCECPPPCEPIMRPVCSKDGRTFPSECEMKRSSCLQRVPIDIAYTGTCGEMGPCSIFECQYGAICVEKDGTARCECPLCSAEFEPVCGSDGITYGNECKLRLESCKHRRDINVLYKGPCNGCENKNCDFHSKCESDGSTEARCVCPETCEDELSNEAVCGTDGVSYENECKLRIASCKAQQYIIVAYKGDCDLCKTEDCKHGDRCNPNDCKCPVTCENSGDEPVCASNMLTYSNECELRKASCAQLKNAPPLTIVFYGECRETENAFTTSGPTTLQSSSDSGTDTALPEFTGSDLTTVEREVCKDIHCDFEATCELGPDGFPRCTCQFDCAKAPNKAVCASDLKIYSSLCAMKMEACQRQEELRLRPLDLCEGMEVKPCKGERPLQDRKTKKDLDCGSGLHRQDCPSGYYCHQTARFARCCRKDENALANAKTCEESWFGCCPDGKSIAKGPNREGCPSLCGCNKLGSYSDTCDPETRQCKCKPGVGGEKCDRCEPGFWGLPKISSGHQGCIPCGCSAFGSVRDDCEQMTGRCVCKPEIQGQKCTVCANHDKILGPNGCIFPDLMVPPSSCKDLTCHFGATCAEQRGQAVCECHRECEEDKQTEMVCGSDGHTYASVCQLEVVACRLQKDIVVQAFGSCKDNIIPGTDWPVRRYTPLQFTQPDDSNSPLSKSTRHLLVPDPRYYYERGGDSLRAPHSLDPETDTGHPAANNLAVQESDNVFNTRGGKYAAAYRPTPATVRVVTALLGDLCSDNNDCLILYSSCASGACSCLSGYMESPDRQECIADVSPPEERSRCSSSPCNGGSTCIDVSPDGFTCVCTANFTGRLCENEVRASYEIPGFDGRSYVKLKPLKAYHKLSIEVEFKTYANDGVILYNQQKADGYGDFVSLALVGGYVEFRYNLGNGVAVITSLDKVQLKQFHRVVIKRYHRDGILKIDESEDVAGQSPGSLKALDLLQDTFVGFVPSNSTRVYENIGTNKGLRGCIRKLKVGRRTVQLHENKDDWVLSVAGVYECGADPCASRPCKNGGVCQKLDDLLYRCECGPDYAGEFCENAVNACQSNPCNVGSACNPVSPGMFVCKCPVGRIGEMCELAEKKSGFSVAQFQGESFVQFPRLEGVGKSFSIEVSFLTKASNGLIFYGGQLKNGRGDFLSLNLVHGRLQFRFNLGSGIANITSKEIVTQDEWHWVGIYRNGREGMLQLDNATITRGYSGPSLTELNLELPFYVGSMLSWQEVHRLSGASKGFKGAIQRIVVNGRPLPLSADLTACTFAPVNDSGCGFKIKTYDGQPCPVTNNPCLNNGVCIPNLNEYLCQCPPNYDGRHCEISKEENGSIRFNGATFLQFKNKGYRSVNVTDEDDFEWDYSAEINDEYSEEQTDYTETLTGRKGERGNRYEIRLRTFIPDGLLLWRSKDKSIAEDYFSIAIVNGFPELSFNLGKQRSFWSVKSKTRIDDGEWHTIRVRRRKRMGFISVDEESAAKGLSAGGAITLRTNSKLWIGGTPSPPQGLPSSYYKGFQGCIHHISVNGKPLDLLVHSDSETVRYCHDNEI